MHYINGGRIVLRAEFQRAKSKLCHCAINRPEYIAGCCSGLVGLIWFEKEKEKKSSSKSTVLYCETELFSAVPTRVMLYC